MKGILKIIAVNGIKIITIFITFVAAFELVSNNRSVAHFSSSFGVCDAPIQEEIEGLNQVLVENRRSIVYLDILLFYCEDTLDSHNEFFSNLNGIQIFAPSGRDTSNPSVSINFSDRLRGNERLSYVGEPGIDAYADRIHGLFFLQGEIEGGHYHFQALPVPFSNEMLRRHICSESLSNASHEPSTLWLWVEAYVRSCIFEQRWDPWGWGSQT